MATDVYDRWTKVDKDTGKRIRSARWGKGQRWAARWRDDRGIQRQKMFDKKVPAQRYQSTVEADLLRHTYIDPQAGKVTFRIYAEKWRQIQVHAEGTSQLVESHFRRHVYPVFGDRQIASIRPSEARAWMKGLEAGAGGRDPLMPSTIQTIRRFVIAVGHAAVSDRVIGSNPFVGLSQPTIVKKRVSPLADDQVSALTDGMPERFRALLPFGAGTGARQGEAIGIEVDGIDFLRRQIEIRQQLYQPDGQPPYLKLPKGDKIRTIPAADRLLLILAEHLRRYPVIEVDIEDRTNKAKPRWRKARFVFLGARGRPLRRTGFSAEVWQIARRHAGVSDEITFHDLRHYYASLLIRKGASPKDIQARLGHASITETFDTYGHLWPDSDDISRAAVQDALPIDVGQMWTRKIA